MKTLLNRIYLHTAPLRLALLRIPLLRAPLRNVSSLLQARDTLMWVRIRSGEARGLWIGVHPRTGKQFYDGGGELAVQRFLGSRLRAGMVFYDLGANFGFFSLLAASLVGADGNVFAFEPDAELAQRIRANAERNGFGNVRVIEKAVWSGSGTVAFESSDPRESPDRGTGHVAPTPAGNSARVVECVALDDFVCAAPAPSVIKCDVEGAELRVFDGAQELLDKYRPVIVCELHSAENGRALRARFEALGYRVAELDENHIVAEQD